MIVISGQEQVDCKFHVFRLDSRLRGNDGIFANLLAVWAIDQAINQTNLHFSDFQGQ